MAHPEDWETRRLVSIHHWSQYGSERRSITEDNLERAKRNYDSWRVTIGAPPEGNILGMEFELNAPRDEEYLRRWIIAYTARQAEEERITQEELVWDRAVWESENVDGDSVASENEQNELYCDIHGEDLTGDMLADEMLGMMIEN